jgi:hypothetical protein
MHIVIPHHFEGDLTRLNKDFHTKFQPTDFKTYRIKSGIACQISIFQDYLNLQSFWKENNAQFSLRKCNDSKSHRVITKGSPLTTPPRTIQNEMPFPASTVENFVQITVWIEKTPLSMLIIELQKFHTAIKSHSFPQSLCGNVKETHSTALGRTTSGFCYMSANCQAPPAWTHCGW